LIASTFRAIFFTSPPLMKPRTLCASQSARLKVRHCNCEEHYINQSTASLAWYAAHRSVSRQYISNLAKRGVLVMRARPLSDRVVGVRPWARVAKHAQTS